MSQVDRNDTPDVRRLGVVSYLNSKPLVQGLEHDPSIELIFDVPARLPFLLDDGRVDVALVPVVDLSRSGRNWQTVSDACIGCDGETLTVRVFSRGPAASIERLHVDGDSHTSVVLARVIWREMFGTGLEVVPFESAESLKDVEAILLIGDKVATQRLIGFDVQTDLGSAWKSLTSLPFVFAVWAAPRSVDLGDLPDRLARARDAGVRSADLIAADYGPGLGFPVEVAKRYLNTRLKFTLGERQREGMSKFLQLARQQGLIDSDSEPKPAPATSS